MVAIVLVSLYNKLVAISPTSSLYRFLRESGTNLLGKTPGRTNAKVQVGIGAALTVLSFIPLTLAGALRTPEIAFGAVGPFIAGTVNWIVGAHYLKKLDGASATGVVLTPEAREMLQALVNETKTNRWGYAHHSAHYPARPAAFLPTNEALGYLESVVIGYHRLLALSVSRPAAGTELAKLLPRLRAAAEEAVAEAFHNAAVLSRYPEGGSTTRHRLKTIAKSLAEVADRAEALAARQPSLTEQLADRSAVTSVLEDLRAVEAAEDELRVGQAELRAQ